MKKKQEIYTNIITGKYKGVKIELPSLEITRSSKSILKESFFNRIQFNIIDSIFIEAFAGSGSIGLEALSRGSDEVIFFEKNKDSFEVLNRNIEKIDNSKAISYYGDSFELLPPILKKLQNKNLPIYLYIDPPFNYRDNMENIYDKTQLINHELQNHPNPDLLHISENREDHL